MNEYLKVQLYQYHLNAQMIFTQYGYIPYLDWLTKEKERIEKDQKRKVEIITRGISSALYVNEVEGCKCEFCKRAYPDHEPGRKHTSATKAKMSLSRRGSGNGNWKGDLRDGKEKTS